MFARVLEFVPKMEKKGEFLRVVKNEILPILKKQHGFLDVLPLFPEVMNEKMIMISLWHEEKVQSAITKSGSLGWKKLLNRF